MNQLIIHGYFLDGLSAKRINASLQLINNTSLSLVIDNNDIAPIIVDCGDIRIEAPLGDTPREIELGDERLFVSDDHEGVEQINKLTQQSAFPFSLEHRLEKSLTAVILFSCLMIGFVWAITVHGIPAAAKTIAFEMPEYIEEQLSTSLDLLDQTVFESSNLPIKKQVQIRTLFAKHLAHHKALNPHIHFRSGMGANALALPNGDIVFTDDLVNLVENEQELVAVLFHELGHLHHKHITRRILQGSMVTLVVILLTGDLDAVDIVTGVPTLVIDLAYSREFELEADRYALSMLKASNISVNVFSSLMTRLSSHANVDGEDRIKMNDFLSTHPHLQDRIKLAEEYK